MPFSLNSMNDVTVSKPKVESGIAEGTLKFMVKSSSS